VPEVTILTVITMNKGSEFITAVLIIAKIQ
jgi:hypothetical protein